MVVSTVAGTALGVFGGLGTLSQTGVVLIGGFIAYRFIASDQARFVLQWAMVAGLWNVWNDGGLNWFEWGGSGLLVLIIRKVMG